MSTKLEENQHRQGTYNNYVNVRSMGHADHHFKHTTRACTDGYAAGRLDGLKPWEPLIPLLLWEFTRVGKPDYGETLQRIPPETGTFPLSVFKGQSAPSLLLVLF